MELAGTVLKIANATVSFVVIVFLCLAGAYAGYSLWDNNQIYSAAENIQQELISLRPETDAESQDNTASFAELQQINEDVCAWVTLGNTRIDYPVLQGENNLKYINTDVYGDFALAGSIFLDSRNSRDFSDTYSLLYGHHMEGGRMFGDLDLYKDKGFFNNNRQGQLVLPNGSFRIEVFACVVVTASDSVIFDPGLTRGETDGFIRYVKKNALYCHSEVGDILKQNNEARILGFSTCSAEFSDARTVLITVIIPN